jgi:hypothetical protein
MLYEVALIEKPTKKEAEDGQIEKLILPPTPVIARDDKRGRRVPNKGQDHGRPVPRGVLMRPFKRPHRKNRNL